MSESDTDERSNRFPLGEPPEFPYDLLVRVPLLGGLIFLLDASFNGFGFLVRGCDASFPSTLLAILLPAFIQLFAVPVAVYILVFGEHRRSLIHWAAMSCGLAQLLLGCYILRVIRFI